MLIDFSKCNRLIGALYSKPVKKIYHVGAHIGEEAFIYAANKVEKVVWFEANDSLLQSLSENISKYDIEQFIVPYALFDENKVLKLNVTNNFQSSSVFELDRHSAYYPQIIVSEIKEVQAYRLDSLIEAKQCHLPWIDFDFINIDTQGSELAVLKGLGNYISQQSLKGIFLEVNSESLYKGIPLVSEIDEFLARHSFFRVLTNWTKEGWGDAFYLKSVTL
ncbi:MAG: FkbM family methyltransferase [Nitrospirae bacterium]|nr:FkbM family methyltransferase [Nitrospirota bacterium]